ncbi:hypothetical protein [Nonomuraea sp. NPDC049709]|uniref:hypothetical protein n=1 Tax=Nonomuraea sp. NPDC049709 TaxID=3154736 RepID=UPI0034304BDD
MARAVNSHDFGYFSANSLRIGQFGRILKCAPSKDATYGIEAPVKVDGKIAVFCREIDHVDLLELARDHGMEDTWRRVIESLRAGRTAGVEEDLDALDRMVARVEPGGLFSGSRAYGPFPGERSSLGGAWWTCPLALCAGRGLVTSQQGAPVCGIGRRSLTAKPL